MGIRFVEAQEDRASTIVDYKEELTRIGGILLGGIIFTAINYTESYAVRNLGIKEAFTLQFSETFMRRMKKSPFKFDVEVIRRAKTYAFVEAGPMTATEQRVP
jgi:acyl-CoA thioesterase